MFLAHRLLLGLQLAGILSIASVSGAIIEFTEGVAGETCFTQPILFSSPSFSYDIVMSTDTQLAEGCTPDQIILTNLYMSGTCLQEPNNSEAGCPPSEDSPTTITGPTVSSGQSDPTSDSNALCNQALTYGTRMALTPGESLDSGLIKCAPSNRGFVYIQNNCAANTTKSIFKITVDYSISYITCTGSGSGSSPSSNYYNDYSYWPKWPLAFAIGGAVFILVFLCLAFLGRRKRQQQLAAQQAGVQMMPPPPPPHAVGVPAPAYSNATGYPAGYPPPQMQGSGEYPGGPPTSPPGYPPVSYSSGSAVTPYPSQPQQFPPPGQVNQPAVWHAGGKPPTT